VRWLATGAVPAGFVGAMVIGKIGHSSGVESSLKIVIGLALLASLACNIARRVLDRRAGDRPLIDRVVVRPGRTVAIGVVGGLAVGMTSVGAGSVVIALLLLAYPQLRPSGLVGTDIVQAIPLVASAALGHMLFGEVHLGVTVSLLIGAIPAVYVGARLSAQAPAGLIRVALAAVLLGSALALLHAPGPLILLGGAAAGALMLWLSRPLAAVSAPAAATEPEPTTGKPALRTGPASSN